MIRPRMVLKGRAVVESGTPHDMFGMLGKTQVMEVTYPDGTKESFVGNLALVKESSDGSFVIAIET